MMSTHPINRKCANLTVNNALNLPTDCAFDLARVDELVHVVSIIRTVPLGCNRTDRNKDGKRCVEIHFRMWRVMIW